MALDIDRHRHMLVRDEPCVFDLAEASGPAKPSFGSLSIRQRSARPIEAVTECDDIAYSDLRVVNLIGNRSLVRRKCFFPMRLERVRSHTLQRGSEIERHDSWRKDRHDAMNVLRAKRLGKAVYQTANLGLGNPFFFICHEFILLRIIITPSNGSAPSREHSRPVNGYLWRHAADDTSLSPERSEKEGCSSRCSAGLSAGAPCYAAESAPIVT